MQALRLNLFHLFILFVLFATLTASSCGCGDGKGGDETVIEDDGIIDDDDTTPPNPCDTDITACLYDSGNSYDLDTFFISFEDIGRLGGPRPFDIAIYKPDVDGELPVVLLSHGGARGKNNPLNSMDKWAPEIAKAGYITIAIAHNKWTKSDQDALCTGLGIPLGTPDCDLLKILNYHRPLDITYVLDWLETQDATPEWSGVIDMDKIAVGGHSAGAGATMMIAGAYRTIYTSRIEQADLRPEVFMAFSPQGPGSEGFEMDSWDDIDRPMLIGTGVGDDTNGDSPANRVIPFQQMPAGEKYQIYIDSISAKHTTFEYEVAACERVESNDAICEEYLDWLGSAALAFLDAHLKDEADAWDWLASDNVEAASGECGGLGAKIKRPKKAGTEAPALWVFKKY